MKRLFILGLIIILSNWKLAAQHNWAAVPCSKMRNIAAVDRMLLDSLHNEIILYTENSSSICNTTYKGLFAYNGYGFHDLDVGVETHRPGLNTGGLFISNCITYGNKTLFGGGFRSIGSNTLYSKGLALWNGAIWDTFPTHVFSNTDNYSGGGFCGFLKHQGKLWMYGAFDTIGNTISKNLVAYDGNTFIPMPSIPANNASVITKMIVYKNKLIATGGFYDYPSFDFFRLAQFDGSSWAQMGGGVRGGFSACQDMAVYKDTLYIAGAFPKGAGNAGNYIMKWDGTQLYDAGFGDFCGYGAIMSLVPYRNRLYAIGGFACAAGKKAFGVAYYENGKWTVPQDSVWGPAISGGLVYNDELYIGGAFKSINGDTTLQKFVKLACPDFDAAGGCLSGLKETSKQIALKVFPNPANDKLHLEFEAAIAIDKVTILNTLGQQIHTLLKPVPKQEIDVSHLDAGIYFLKAENRQGQSVFKVVKE